MAKSSGPLILVAGAAALLLMGGKKKKKTSDDGGGSSNGDDSNSDGGGGSSNGGGGSSNGGGGKSGGGSKSDSDRAKAAGGIWVSSDCKKIEYEGGDPEAWWLKRGKSAAQNFIDANYHDPYEIARTIIIQLVPCAAEFPVMTDDIGPMQEEYNREQFLRNFTDAYYLIQWLYNAISELMDTEEYVVELDDRCEFVFMGDKWLDVVAGRMIRFYLDYQYPTDSDENYKASWMGADLNEKVVSFADNIALAVVNRMHPECAWQIMAAFKKDPWEAKGFFNTRPGMKAAYDQIVSEVHSIDDNRSYSIPFDPMS